MSNTYIADSTDDSKNDDTLIIIVNADGTLSVDPETLQKLIANQHHKTGISVVRVGGDGSNTCGDGTCGDTNDAKGSSGEVNSHVNLTVEGFYPPEHIATKTADTVPPSNTVPPPSTPTTLPSATTSVLPSDNGGADVLSDPFSEMDAEEIQKLETALQSEQAKQILGENVTAMLDMLNVEDGGSSNSGSSHISHQEAVRMDHCYTNLSGPTTTTTVTTVQSVVTTAATSPSSRGRGRGKGGRGRGALTAAGPTVLQMKGIPSGATLVPVVKQLVLPVSAIHPGTVTVNKLVTTTGNTVGQSVQLQRPVQRVIVQNNAVIASEPAIGGAGLIQLQQNAKVVVTKINAIPTSVITPVTAAVPNTQPSVVSAANKETAVNTEFETDFLNKKVTIGRGRARTRGAMRGRGIALGVTKKRVGRGGGAHKLNAEEEERARRLEEEMAAALEAMSTSPKQEQVITVVDNPQEEDTTDAPKKDIATKATDKKIVPLKVGKKAEDGTTKKVKDKIFVPTKVIPQKLKANRKSADSVSSDASPISDDKVLSPVAVTTAVTTVIQPRSTTTAVVAPGPAVSPSTPSAQRKNYPKRENRKPPAHLVDTLGPALFSTPDIIRRVSTDKQLPPVSPSPATTSQSVTSPTSQSVTPLPTTAAQQQVTTNVTSSSTMSPPDFPSQTVPAQTTSNASSSLPHKPQGTGLEDELTLIDGTGESLLDSIHAQVTKQEEQLLAEALMLDDLPAVQTDEISEDSMGAAVAVEVLPEQASHTSVPSEDDVQHAAKRQQQSKTVKTMSQTSLMAYFPKASKDQPKNVDKSPLSASGKSDKEPKVLVESIAVVDSTTAVDTQSVLEISKPIERKLPPVEVPATRSASKRATQQKAQTQEPTKEVATRKVSVSSTRERRKSSSDSKKRSMDSNDSDGQMGVSEDDDDESWNSEDDPDRLWCICKKPHNNRFMICCDSCEDWFHGKCVGITKAMGEQMEEKGIEWSCPNCKKKRAAEVKEAKKQVEQKKEFKKSISQDLIKSGPVKNVETKDTRSSTHVAPNVHNDDSGLSSTGTVTHIQSSQSSGGHCIVCKKEPSAGSIYCSDDCIKKHASESLALISKENLSGGSAPQSVIVFERKTGRLLAGPSAPLASGLTSWLLTHPTYEVMCPGVLPTAKFYTQKSASGPVSAQQKTPQIKTIAVAQKVQKQTSTPLLRQTLLVSRNTVKTTTPAAAAAAATTTTTTTTTAPLSQITPVQKPQVGSTSGPKLQQTTLAVSSSKAVSTQGPVVVKQEPSTAVHPPVKSPVQKVQVVTLQKSQQSTALPKGQQQITQLLKPQQQQQQQVTSQEVTSEPARINTTRTTSISSTSSMSPPSSSSSISVITKKHASATVKEAIKKQKQSKLNLTAVKKPVKEENKAELKRSDSQMSTGKREDGPEPIRENVRKTLQESLLSRIKECEDISIKEQEVKTIAQSIEEELYALFKDTGTKYKSKYRSLVFNIKDPKNLTLFQKIVDSSISPQQLVRLSAEEMASQELAQWREREARHQLEMIKKNELDLLQQAKTVVMKTHKGELVIESEDGLGSKNPDTSVTELETALSETMSEPVLEPVKEKETVSKKDDKHEKDKEEKDKRKHSSRKKEDRHRDKKHSRKSRSHDKEHRRDRSRSRSKSRSRRHSDKGRDTKKDDIKSKEKKIEESDYKSKFEETESHLLSEIKEIVEEVIQEEVIQETGDIEEEDLTEEPSSTVNIKTPPYIESETENKPALWRGYLLMNDVAKFATTIQEVSGDCEELPNDLPETVDCVGRIHPDTVWEYIAKMKKSGSKQILVIRFSPENEEEKMSYLSLYSYLSSKNRMGVVGNASVMIKDFYVMPLASHNPVPQVLLPLDGPGFEDYRPHLLLGIIVRTRRKRLMTDRDLPFIPKVPKRTERSYTPPLPEEGNVTPVQSGESFTPPHNSPVSSHPRLITLKHKSSRHSTKDPPFSPPAEDVIEDGDAPYSPADEDTPYSPGEGEDEEMPPPASPGDMEVSAELQRKMDELNRRIEEQKQQIQSIVAHSGNIATAGIVDSQEDEAYSPSRSFTPPPAAMESIPFLDNQNLPDIALPSNLQEILASIKKQPEPKGLTLKLDPIVQAYSKAEEPYSPEDKPEPPVVINDVDDFTSASVTPPDTISAQPTPAPVKINRDPRQRGDSKSIRTSLSQLSDEDLIRKAAEMGFMNPENPETLSNESSGKSLVDQPPPPGLEDEYHSYDTVQKPVKSAPINSGPGPPIMPSSTPSYPPPAAPYSAPPYGSYPPIYPPPNFSSQSVYQPSQHIPFTNPQPPPPPQPIYQPPPPQPPPPQPQPVPPPPKESSTPAKKEHTLITRKLKKSTLISSGDKPRTTRKFPEQLKSYDDGKESLRKREKFLHKRGRRQNWESVEKRKDSWDYEQPPHPPPSIPSSSSMRGVMRGRYPHSQRGFPMRRGFDHRGGYHRGFHRQRGHPMGPPRGGYPPKHHSGIQNEWDETIRHFEVKHRERNNKLKRRIEKERRWRGGSSPPRKKRNKDSDSEG